MGFPLSRDEFPDTIAPVTAATLPVLKNRLRGDGITAQDAASNYARLSAQIAILTGHEHAHDRQGRPYTRQEWEDVIHKALSHLNTELSLGLAPEAVEVMTLCYTVLQEASRYGGDPLIGKAEGESTAVHSLHTLLQAQYVYQKALEENPALGGDVDFFRNFQLTCLLLATHDLGEMLGEAGNLAAVAEAGTFSVKDKTEFERSVVNFAVRLAAQTVIDRKPHEDFYGRIDTVRKLMNVQNQGGKRSDGELAAEMASHMQGEIKFSTRAEKLFSFLRDCWGWVEEPAHSRQPFLGHLAVVCEHMQGTRHLNRHMRGAKSPVADRRGNITFESNARFIPGYRIMTNARYLESNLGALCASADMNVLREKAVAEQAAQRVYKTSVDFLQGTKAFFRDPAIKETRLHNDGMPFTAAETAQRRLEIKAASQVARFESRAARGLSGKFNDAVFTGWTALTGKQAISLYTKAIDTGYLPGMAERGGKQAGEILLIDLPTRLTAALVLSDERKAAITAQSRELIPAAMRPT